MPGDNCAVFGCRSSRREKRIGIWKLPAAKDEEHKKWREDCLREITKMQEIDQDFRKRIESDKVFTCEKHFEADDIEICESFKFLFTSLQAKVDSFDLCKISFVFTLICLTFVSLDFLLNSSVGKNDEEAKKKSRESKNPCQDLLDQL